MPHHATYVNVWVGEGTHATCLRNLMAVTAAQTTAARPTHAADLWLRLELVTIGKYVAGHGQLCCHVLEDFRFVYAG